MKLKLLLFSLVSWLALTAVQAQTTVTIGAGSTTGGAFDNGAPVYRSSATSSFDFSQSLLLYTEDDLAAVGIYNGAVISSVGFYKLAGTEITAGEVANLSIDLGNTTSDVLDVADTYANLSSGFTSVYSGTVDNTVFSTASLVTIPFQNNFTYNGGSIIVGVNWDISGPTPPATGSFQWLYDSGTATIQARGTSSGSAITGNLTTTRSGLYQADFTYTGGAPPTCIRPNTLGATNITTTSADLTWVSGGSGETSWDIEVVTAGTAPTGTPTNTGVTSPFNVPALSSNTAYDFYVRANCGGGDFSVYAGPFTFTTLITCGDTIYDSGGATGDYVANELTTITLFPDNAGDVARLEFLLVDLEACCDDIAVYDGVDTSAPLLDGDVANVDVADGDTSIVFTAREASGALTLVFDADGSVQNAGFEAVFTCIVRPTCFPPTALSVSNITDTTADADWTTGDAGETLWDVEVVPSGTTPTGTPQFTDVTKPYTIPGLSPATVYDYYVRASCGGGDFSEFSVPESFRTTGPLDDCTTGDTLTVVTDCATSTPYSFDLSSAGNLGTSFGSCDTSGTNTGGWFEFTTTAVTTITINTTTAMKMEIVDACGGTQVECFNSTSTSRIVSGLTANTNYKLALWVDGTSSDTTDICIVEGPTCFLPTGLSVDSVTQTEATLSWTAPAQGTAPVSYNVEVVTAGTAPTGTATDTGVTSPFIKTGLSTGTAYDFYVSSDCGAGDTSSYEGPVSFTTTPGCGDTLYDTGGSTGDYSANEDYTITFIPDSVTDFAQLEFQLVDLEVNTFGGGFYDNILIYDGLDSSAPLITDEVQLVDIANGDQPIIYTATNPDGALTLRFDSDFSGQNAGFEVLFNCVPRPACLPPADLAVNVVDGTTAEYSWTTGQSMETMWDVAIVLAGAAAPTTATIEDVTANPYTDATLTAGTRYDFYLRADCGGSTSDFAGPISFRTPGDGDTCDTPLDITVAAVCDATTQVNIDFENAIDLGSDVASCASSGPNLGSWLQFRPNRNTSAIFINSSETVQYALFTTDAAGNCADVEIACGTLDAAAQTEIGQLNFRDFYKLVVWDDSGQLTSANICVEDGPTCPTPFDLGITNVQPTEADFFWTSGSTSQTSFDVAVFVGGADPLVDTPLQTATVTTNSYTATALVVGDSYDFYVTGDCDPANAGTDVSMMAGPLQYTQVGPGESCAASINMVVNADCADVNASTYTIDFATAADIGPAPSCDTFGVNTGVWLDFVAPSNGGVIVNFTNTMEYALFDSCGGTEILCSSAFGVNTTGIVSGLVAGASYKMVLWKDTATTGTSDICIQEAPSCLPVTNITATNATASGADISWDLGDLSQTLFDIEVVESGDPQTGANIISGVTNPYTINTLNAATSYDVYVRADCGAGDLSTWTGPTAFDTACVTITPDYAETFDNYLPVCWSEAGDGDLANGPDPSTSTSNWIADGFANNGSTGSARVEIWLTNDVEWLITPGFDLSAGGYEVNFDVALTPWSGSGPDVIAPDDQVQFLISENGGAWTELVLWDENNIPSNTGDVINIPLASTSTNVKFAFLSTEGPTASGDVNFYVDNFQVRTIPSCFEVSNLAVVNATTTTAAITFDSGNAASSGNFEYAAVPAGDPAPTGAGVAISDAAVTNGSYAFTIGDGTTTGPALLASTAYDLYVREVCGAGDASLYSITPVSFATLCDVFNAPYTADFEDFTPTLDFTGENCWNENSASLYDWEVDGLNGTDSANTGPSSALSGSNFLVVDASDGASGDVAIVDSPTVDLTGLTTPGLTFFYHMYGNAITALEVEISSDSGATFTNVLTVTGQQQSSSTDPWSEQIVDLSAFANQSIIVRFKTTKSSGSLVFEGDVSLDNFTIDNLPTCLVVDAITVVSTTTTTADITFDSGNATSSGNFEYVLVPAGDPAPTGAGIAISDATVTNGSYAFTIGDGTTTGPALLPSTAYDLYVREICGASDASTYNFGGISLETQCAPITVYPHTTTFVNNPPTSCWEEAGDGLPATGPTGLGVSDWRSGRDYTNYNGQVVPSNAINLFGSTDQEWLISGEYDLTGTTNDFLTIETAVTNWNNSAQTDTMGSDDEVQLLVTTDAGATWINLFTWNVQNQPEQSGTREYINISAYSGIAQFAIFATDGATNDAEDYDFHVGTLIIDATAGNGSVELTNEISLYPNPVSGDVLNIKWSNAGVDTTNVIVHNSLGQQVMSREVSLTSQGFELNGMTALSRGLYFVTISASGENTTLKFIKE
jgi:hypothetical protein